MPVSNESEYHSSGFQYPASGGQTPRFTPESDTEYVPDSEEERKLSEPGLTIKGAAKKGPTSGRPSSSGDRYGGENDRHRASGTGAGNTGGRRRSSSADNNAHGLIGGPPPPPWAEKLSSGQHDRAHTHAHAHRSSGGPPPSTSSSSSRPRDERSGKHEGPTRIIVSESGPHNTMYPVIPTTSSTSRNPNRRDDNLKRPYEGPHGQRGSDSGRGERGPSRRGSGADAGGGGGGGGSGSGNGGGGSGGGGSGRYETEPLNTRHPQDDSRRIQELDCEEQYFGPDAGAGAGGPQEGVERRGGGMGDGFGGGSGGGPGSGRTHGPGSSNTRSYANVIASPPDPTHTRPPREGRPPHQGSAPPGLGAPPPQIQMQQVQPGHGHGQGQGPPPPRQEIPQGHPGSPPQGRPEGPPPHNQGGHSRGHGGRPDGQGGQSSSASAQAARMKANEGQQYQEEHQSGSGKGGLFGKVASYLTGSSAPAPPECQGHEAMLLEKDQQLQFQHQDMQRMKYTIQGQGEKIKHLERQIAGLQENLRIAQTEFTNVQKELVDAKALSDTRGKELLGAQTFLTKADSVSVSELVGMARTVNDEVIQTAASIGEQFSPENYMDTADDPQQWHEIAVTSIGPELTRLLEDFPDKSEVNPLIAQIAVQALLCRHLAMGIRRWYRPKGVRTEEVLQTLYDDIRLTENQAVSGRWRALTRARLRLDIKHWMRSFFEELETMMHVAGWTFTDPAVKGTLAEKFEATFKAAEKLNIAMGEQFTSADIEVAMPETYMPFNPRELEDEWGDTRNPNSSVQDVVAGTTGIGLMRRVVHEGNFHYEIILPPKVVLLSTLKEILEPPPPVPTSKRKKAAPADGSG